MELFGQNLAIDKPNATAQRLYAIEETYARIQPLLPQLGITRIANVTGLDRLGLPTCVAFRPNAKSLSTAQGKSDSLLGAKVSAAMEAIESWHGEQLSGPLHFASYSELSVSDNALDPAQLCLRADARFEPEKPLCWVAGEELVSQQQVWVPFELAHNNFVESKQLQATFLKSTNGLSSGNHLAEAIFYGLLEVIERDALTLWELKLQKYGETFRLAQLIDIDSLPFERPKTLLQDLQQAGVVSALWNITSDIGIPAFSCQLIDDPASPLNRAVPSVSGYGCHPVPEIAIRRAIDEAIQSRVTLISGSRDDMFPSDYAAHSDATAQTRTIAQWRAQNHKIVYQSLLPQFRITNTCANFGDDIQQIVQLLQAQDIDQIAVVDLTQAHLNIPVVKVIVPKMEAMMSGLYRPNVRGQALLADLSAPKTGASS